MMAYLETAYDNYDGQDPTFSCTGNKKIDRILEQADLKEESAMEVYDVYTWSGFCSALRLFTDNGNAPAPATTTEAPAPATTTEAPAPATTTEAPAPAATTNSPAPTCGVEWGECAPNKAGVPNCCAEGLYCKFVNQWWSSCQKVTSSTQAPPVTTTPAPAPVTTTAAPAPVTTTAAPAPSPTGNCVDSSMVVDSECGGADYHGTECCAEGLQCYAQSEWYSSCRQSCGAGFLCNTQPANRGTTCPQRIVGSKCRGTGFTTSDIPAAAATGSSATSGSGKQPLLGLVASLRPRAQTGFWTTSLSSRAGPRSKQTFLFYSPQQKPIYYEDSF